MRRSADGIEGALSLAADIGQLELALDFEGELVDASAGPSISGQIDLMVRQADRLVSYSGSVSYRSDRQGSVELVGSLTGRINANSPELRAEIIVDQTLNPLSSVIRYAIDRVVPADWAMMM